MKTMDGGGFEARAVFAGGGNIIDFLALAGVDTAKAICAVRDEFRRADPRTAAARLRRYPRAAPGAGRARRSRSRCACSRPVSTRSAFTCRSTRGAPTRHSSSANYLSDVARAIFERVGDAASVQVVGGLSVAEAQSLAQAGLRAFVISGNLGQPDGRARYDLPPDGDRAARRRFHRRGLGRLSSIATAELLLGEGIG